MNAILALILRLILLLLFYIFIAWIGYTLFNQLKQELQTRHQSVYTPITLQATKDGDIQTKTFEISEILIGRDPACHFPLNHETISLHHAKISFHHKQWWVEDLGSTNGTFLNQNKIEAPTVLTNYDQVTVGGIQISITTQ
jgi:hypothetical protein